MYVYPFLKPTQSSNLPGMCPTISLPFNTATANRSSTFLRSYVHCSCSPTFTTQTSYMCGSLKSSLTASKVSIGNIHIIFWSKIVPAKQTGHTILFNLHQVRAQITFGGNTAGTVAGPSWRNELVLRCYPRLTVEEGCIVFQWNCLSTSLGNVQAFSSR